VSRIYLSNHYLKKKQTQVSLVTHLKFAEKKRRVSSGSLILTFPNEDRSQDTSLLRDSQ